MKVVKETYSKVFSMVPEVPLEDLKCDVCGESCHGAYCDMREVAPELGWDGRWYAYYEPIRPAYTRCRAHARPPRTYHRDGSVTESRWVYGKEYVKRLV